jgi:sugar O-acyltransferase (sialic acid O-acetyltransferase NeuD family)
LKKTIIFGLTGLSKGLIEEINRKEYCKVSIDYVYIDKEYRTIDYYRGLKIISDTNLLKDNYCIILSFQRNLLNKWRSLAEKYNMSYLDLIHEDTYISKNSKIGKGCFVAQNNIIESDVNIGNFFICGYQNRIGHDSTIGDNCHVYVQSNIGGFNTIGNNVDICSSSATREKITVGDNSIIGLGAIVFKDVKENTVMIGNPAKGIKNAN